MADLDPLGVELIAEGADEYVGALSGAADATSAFESATGLAAGAVSGGATIITGALLHIGEIAVDAMASAAGAVTSFFTDGFSGALEAEQTLTRISGLITSTGGAAGLTVDDVSDLATQFMDLAGGSDDAVLAIEEMALRMGNISADEMPGFIQTVLDMAAATGTDAVAAARLLAQAQEDPISALSRLKRQGILVNEETEAQMKAMIEAGDTAGAYALLMDRVGQATGGQAAAQSETLAGKLEILKGRVGEAGETLMSAFVGPISDLLTPAMDTLIPKIDAVAGGISGFITGIISGDPLAAFGSLRAGIDTAFGPEVGNLVSAAYGMFVQVSDFIQTNWPLIQSTFETVWGAISSVIDSVVGLFTDTLMPAISTIVGSTNAELPTAQQTFETVMAVVSTVVTTAAEFITNVLVPAITAAVEWVVANWPTIQATIETVMANVQTVISTVLSVVQSVIETVLTGIQTFWAAHGDSVMTIVQFLADTIQTNIENAVTTIQSVIEFVLGAIEVFWGTWGDAIMSVVDNMVESIGFTIDLFAAAFEGDWTAFGETLRELWDNAWENITTIVSTAIDAISNIDWGAIGSGILSGIAGGITAGTQFIVDAATNAAQAALDAAKAFLGISSPSKVAAAEVGDPFVEGIAQAIEGGVHDIEQASVGLAAGMIAPPAAAAQMAVGGTTYSRSASAQFGDVNIYSGMDQATFEARVRQVVEGML